MRLAQILLGVLLLGISGLDCRQSLGQAIPVQLSKETTFITEPLAVDGLPNFALAIMEREKEGVTPENNGARLFWIAMGPEISGAKLDEEQFNLRHGIDDHGTDFSAPIVDGEWVAPSEHIAADEDASDFVLRVPVSRPPWAAQQ
jgi:hypothetical protein